MTRAIQVEHNGVTYDAQVATIESTMLGFEDHGMFTGMLRFKGESWGQGAPAYILNESCGSYVRTVLETLGLNEWEELKGTRCLVLRERRYDAIMGIAHLTAEDSVMIFADWLNAWRDEHDAAGVKAAGS